MLSCETFLSVLLKYEGVPYVCILVFIRPYVPAP